MKDQQERAVDTLKTVGLSVDSHGIISGPEHLDHFIDILLFISGRPQIIKGIENSSRSIDSGAVIIYALDSPINHDCLDFSNNKSRNLYCLQYQNKPWIQIEQSDLLKLIRAFQEFS